MSAIRKRQRIRFQFWPEVVTQLAAEKLDKGTEHFDPSHSGFHHH